MKLATIRDGSVDGRLVVVSGDLARAVPAEGARTMQEALERWTEIEESLLAQSAEVNVGASAAFDPTTAMAPLPRAWQWLDGSVFQSHGDLMDAVFGMDKKERTPFPLMYQGVSDRFYGPGDEVRMPNEDDGLDFEGEFGIITDRVPMGSDAVTCAGHIRLIVQINDWSLRKLAPVEMKTGFGWIRAKPPCSMAPVAVTPDELGAAWRDNRVDLPLNVSWNGEKFGAASGYPMAFGFDELVSHAAYSRDLVAGTVIGSGTVSNESFREVGSSCIAERRGIETIDLGEARTPYMSFGDRVRMEVFGRDGQSVFGAIDQKVVSA